ncbi:MAG: hypothetical protein U1D55_12135 [Phycisphaerae bacterium]
MFLALLASLSGRAKARPQCVGSEWVGTIAGTGLGYTVALEDNVAAIPEYDGVGAIHVFERASATWTPFATLTPQDASGRIGFPQAVGASAVCIVGSAPFDDDHGQLAGALYVFQAEGGLWQPARKLYAADAYAGLRLGWSVAVSGDTIVAGAPYGWAAYVFHFDGTAWSQEARLVPNSTDGVGFFGESVAIDGNLIAVGDSDDYTDGLGAGAAYVFERDAAGAWRQSAKIRPIGNVALNKFGRRVAISGSTFLSGGYQANGQQMYAGAAYVFERNLGGVWTQTARLIASDGENSDVFGGTVALDRNVAVIGAWGDDDVALSAGAAYVFVRGADGVWRETAKLTAPDGAADDNFGDAVAVSGDTAIIGAWHHDTNGPNSGAAYVFAVGPDHDGDGVMDVCECLGDLNADRMIDELDLGLMLQAWYATQSGDLDGDADTDESDLGLLLANWQATCP